MFYQPDSTTNPITKLGTKNPNSGMSQTLPPLAESDSELTLTLCSPIRALAAGLTWEYSLHVTQRPLK